jgi:hypothetical protein
MNFKNGHHDGEEDDSVDGRVARCPALLMICMLEQTNCDQTLLSHMVAGNSVADMLDHGSLVFAASHLVYDAHGRMLQPSCGSCGALRRFHDGSCVVGVLGRGICWQNRGT